MTTTSTDIHLKQAVIAELSWQPTINDANIGVSVHRGTVTLSGEVDSYPEQVTAVKVTQRVHGVTAIAQEIKVGDRVWGSNLSDVDVARHAGEALDRAVDVPHVVKAAVHDQVIQEEIARHLLATRMSTFPARPSLPALPNPATGPSASSGGLDDAAATAAVRLAARAPSIHNTQPWSWELRGGVLSLRADRSRQLAVADPYGHSLLVSCGATLEAAQIALRAQGWDVVVQRFPDPDAPDLLAELRGVGLKSPAPQSRALADAVDRRWSERRPFGVGPVTEQSRERLRLAGCAPHVFAHFPVRLEEQLALAVAISHADRVEREDPAYVAELRSWTRAGAESPDGVGAAAVVHVPSQSPRHTDVPLRDFEVGVTGSQLIEPGVDEHPELAIVLTDSDQPVDQLAAGEAVMRLMAEAELQGLATCALSQATDMVAFRMRLRGLMNWQTYPQIMIRIGARPAGAPAQRSRRRPLDDVLRCR